MKKIHIVGLVAIAVMIGIIISMAGSYSQYENFSSAAKTQKEVQVVGDLVKTKKMDYDPVADPNHFTFYMTDENKKECKVIYAGEKPPDFERSENIVITGKMEGEIFMASKILMKCPSKYKNNELASAETK